MHLKSKIIAGLCLAASSLSLAQNNPVVPPPGLEPIPPGGYAPVVIAKLLYDCPEGPGYLRVLAVDRWGTRQSRTLFVGSRKACLAQAADLEKKRPLATSLAVIAACSGNATYLVRWMFNEYGVMQALPHVYFKDVKECLAKAAALNASAAP